jgi:hypothetical protein
MTPDHIPPDALFIQWGQFKAGATGIPAVVTLGLLTFAAAALGLWW